MKKKIATPDHAGAPLIKDSFEIDSIELGSSIPAKWQIKTVSIAMILKKSTASNFRLSFFILFLFYTNQGKTKRAPKAPLLSHDFATYFFSLHFRLQRIFIFCDKALLSHFLLFQLDLFQLIRLIFGWFCPY